MSALIHLIYVSKSSNAFSSSDIIDLLSKSRDRNRQLNVTGMLLYEQGSFFQVLEGEEDVVNNLFATICNDPRHTSIVKIISEAIFKRDFVDWSMGYAAVTVN